MSLAERWPSASNAASVGESIAHAAVRKKVNQFLRTHSVPDPSPAFLLGRLNIDPSHESLVRDIIEGQTSTPCDSYNNESQELGDSWELTAIVDGDGEEHPPGEGGIDMKPLQLPVKHVLENTRLRHDLAGGEVFRNGKTEFASHNPETIARSFVEQGVTDPEMVDKLLIVEDYHSNNRNCMQYSTD
jgi:hypothetical protein